MDAATVLPMPHGPSYDVALDMCVSNSDLVPILHNVSVHKSEPPGYNTDGLLNLDVKSPVNLAEKMYVEVKKDPDITVVRVTKTHCSHWYHIGLAAVAAIYTGLGRSVLLQLVDSVYQAIPAMSKGYALRSFAADNACVSARMLLVANEHLLHLLQS